MSEAAVVDHARYQSSDASDDQTVTEKDSTCQTTQGGTQQADADEHQHDDKAHVEQAYPTDAAERKRNAKRAAKAAGVEWITKPRHKPVEEHYDGSGEDFRAIEASLSQYGSAPA